LNQVKWKTGWYHSYNFSGSVRDGKYGFLVAVGSHSILPSTWYAYLNVAFKGITCLTVPSWHDWAWVVWYICITGRAINHFVPHWASISSENQVHVQSWHLNPSLPLIT